MVVQELFKVLDGNPPFLANFDGSNSFVPNPRADGSFLHLKHASGVMHRHERFAKHRVFVGSQFVRVFHSSIDKAFYMHSTDSSTQEARANKHRTEARQTGGGGRGARGMDSRSSPSRALLDPAVDRSGQPGRFLRHGVDEGTIQVVDACNDALDERAPR